MICTRSSAALSAHATFPWPQFDESASAVRRDIVVEPPQKNFRSSVGATFSDYAAPDGAKTKSNTASYKDAAPDGAVLSKNAVTKIAAVASGGDTFPGSQLSECSSRRQEAHTSSEAGGKKDQSLVTSAATLAKITAPGGPKHYPDAKQLVTEDCIRPVEANA